MSWVLEARTYGVQKQHYIVAHTVVKQTCKNVLFGEKNINGGIDITSLYGDVGRNINGKIYITFPVKYMETTWELLMLKEPGIIK